MNLTIFVVIVFLLFSVGLLLFGILLYSANHRRHHYQNIAREILVRNEGTEITLKPALKIKKRFQKIELAIPGVRCSINEKGNYLPDGAIIEPDVELLDEYGNWHRLAPGSSGVSDYAPASETLSIDSLSFRLNSESIPRNTRFTSLRLRNHTPFTCSNIRWHTYYPK